MERPEVKKINWTLLNFYAVIRNNVIRINQRNLEMSPTESVDRTRI